MIDNEEVKDVDTSDDSKLKEQELVNEVLAKALEEEEAKSEEVVEEDELSEDTDPRELKISDLEDRLRRQMAEFDNFRKRTEKEKSAMFDMGAKHIIESMLPAIDNFERGLKVIPVDKEAKAFYDGIDMIYKQMIKSLSDIGVVAIDCVGKEFDPDLHNAVMHVEDSEVSENIVIEEFQKGYMYKDTVIRHSMVKVAN